MKIKNRQDLEKIKASQQIKLAMREAYKRVYVVVEMGDSGIKAGAKDILQHFVKTLNSQLILNVAVLQGPGTEHKDLEPVVEVRIGDEVTLYQKVTKEVVDVIISEHILKGKVVKAHLLKGDR